MDMILFEVLLKSIRLDSTTTDITTALFILEIMSLYYDLILWNQVDILQKHFKNYNVRKKHAPLESGRGFTVVHYYISYVTSVPDCRFPNY